MILNVFILVLVVEIIANKPPSQYWAGGPITKYRCQPGKKLWCSREYPPPPHPWIPPLEGPFNPPRDPHMKRDRGPPKDG